MDDQPSMYRHVGRSVLVNKTRQSFETITKRPRNRTNSISQFWLNFNVVNEKHEADTFARDNLRQ